MRKNGEIIYWIPRTLAILLVTFLFMFSFDIFNPELSLQEILVGILMHNIPVIIFTGIIIVSWKKEIIAAICFFLVGSSHVAYTIYGNTKGQIKGPDAVIEILLIAGPAFLIAFFYFLAWRKRTKQKAVDT